MPSVLIVEDNGGVRRLLSHWFGVGEWEVFGATTASEGLVIACEKRPSTILLDYMLPGSPTELESVRAFVQTAPYSTLIVFTGHAHVGPLVMSAGAHDFLVKGRDEENIHSIIRAGRWRRSYWLAKQQEKEAAKNGGKQAARPTLRWANPLLES